MNEFEFSGFNTTPQEVNAVEKTENSSFLDLVDWDDCSDNKFLKKAKKASKLSKKNNKKIKKLSSKQEVIEKEVSVIKADIKSLKKVAYDSKFAELVNSDNITERKRLANELSKMEV